MRKISVLQIMSGAVLALAFVQPASAGVMNNAYKNISNDYKSIIWEHDKKTEKKEYWANRGEHEKKQDSSNNKWTDEYKKINYKHKISKKHRKDRMNKKKIEWHKKQDTKMGWKDMGDHKKPKPYVPVPAPSILMLLSAGLIGVVAVNRRRRSKS